jgi:tripartite ATP-independent transporter DctM subunit
MTTLLLALLLIGLIVGLLSGYPVAFVLGGVALLIAFLGEALGVFDMSFIAAFPSRIYGIMTNDLLIAVPLFVFMGGILERSKIAEELLSTMSRLCGNIRAGLGLSVIVVGAILAASTGIVGATVVTMGMISLPTMLKKGYCPKLSTGLICASGTLGQIIPPSIVLILLGDQISSANQTAQMKLGNFAVDPVSVADLFMGALFPGLALVALYAAWLFIYGHFVPHAMPKEEHTEQQISRREALKILMPPLSLIVVVLGSILTGVATATESASVGAIGAMVLALMHGKLTRENLRDVARSTTRITCMVFTILIGASVFTLVFRGLGGDHLVHDALSNMPGGVFMAMVVTMAMMFFLGFFLDFIEIIFVVVPIVAPVLLMMGVDPIWLAIMIAVNLQTSFLTPPFGFALFYLRGVAPKEVSTLDIYKGIVPFVAIQLVALILLALFPAMATWLPEALYGTSQDTAAPTHELLEEMGESHVIEW